MTQAATLAQLASSGALSADTSGNVGIGTSNSGLYGKLGVIGSNYQGVFVQSSDASGVVSILAANSSSETRVGSISNHPLWLMVNGDNKARIDTSGNFQFNSGYGSVATAYGCRAWVNFNGTGTVAIRASGNVTSITDNGVGDYTLNFTTAMPDANYAVVGCGENNRSVASNTVRTNTTSVANVITRTVADVNADSSVVAVSIFR